MITLVRQELLECVRGDISAVYENFEFLQAKEKDGEESGDEDENEKDSALPKGCVIHFSDAPDKCTREDIKERLGELDASVAFVDFKMGDTEGWIRLQGENSAKSLVDKMEEGKVSPSAWLLSFSDLHRFASYVRFL